MRVGMYDPKHEEKFNSRVKSAKCIHYYTNRKCFLSKFYLHTDKGQAENKNEMKCTA